MGSWGRPEDTWCPENDAAWRAEQAEIARARRAACDPLVKACGQVECRRCNPQTGERQGE